MTIGIPNIPTFLLTNTVQYCGWNKELGEDGDYNDAVKVKRVYFEEQTQLVYGDKGNTVKGLSWMIYSETKSIPSNIKFKEKDKVKINDNWYTVINVAKLGNRQQEVTLQ